MNPGTAQHMGLRRLAIAVGVAGFTLVLLGLGWNALAAGGWTVCKALILICLAANAPWLGLTAATALAGLGVRLLAPDPLAAVLPAMRHVSPYAPIATRTVIAMCVRFENMQAILPPLERLLRDLRSVQQPEHFTLAILSDTPEGPAAAAEAAAIMHLAARYPQGTVCYRRRVGNVGFKAGNVMQFLDHHTEAFDFMLLLDADSVMSANAVRRLVRVMQAESRLAILQPTIAGFGADTAFVRIFGFGHRHCMRIWATGQAWWQGPEGTYWGHNALLRIASFRKHCRLPLLPNGGAILSHDLVEAARLHAAGWAVRVLPDDAGSAEGHPPDLLAMLDRDVRWATGNLQYRHLLRRRDLGRIGRLQMLQAILHYALTPLWFAPLPLAALNVLTGRARNTSHSALLMLLAFGFVLMYLPKFAGYVEAMCRPAHDRRRDLLIRMAREILFAILLDSITALDRSVAVLRLAAGRRVGWAPQRREAGSIPWSFGLRRFGLHMLVGLTLMLAFAQAGWFAVAAALPTILGLLLAVPFAVLTARQDVVTPVVPPLVAATRRL
ncbi:glucans biosynthesis glucosyltransferase MdoH [Rhodopila sp.]|uniref:glucans biosynthesis glucosyltransferase MdoH n=1 Tax=Rhodopila sp. TaxID=2480087 RepID=UPI003D0A1061